MISMKKTAALLAATALMAVPSWASAIVGDSAPAFTAVNTKGEQVSLADFAGKTVVMEWTNHGCPFVVKHYADPRKNMQGLQIDYAAEDDDVVWLSVISSAPGKQGHVSGSEADELTTSRGAKPTHVLIDESGELGKLYGAKTTPHMFVIDADEAQTLRYDGAIDSKASANKAHIDTAENYVRATMASLESGEAVEPSKTKPYGCSVKYAS